ncbi:Hint domain-containing protein [Shimia sp. NS0008-38b]|uniref:Hint domain-containing protein n=1 Tax=Shimia sp. NS0008-38b TaxID=3127653 RepID=UPI0031045950
MFVAGTLVTTADGDRLVEDLVAGDMVLTMDHGFQTLRWVGHRLVKSYGLLAPVRIAPGTMGNEQALFVSPQHRMLVSGWRVEINFGDEDVLAPAHSLMDGDMVVQVPGGGVTYLHLVFDQHEVVYGAGIPSESFMPRAQGLSSMEQAVQTEIHALFPELLSDGFETYGHDVQPATRAKEARVLIH